MQSTEVTASKFTESIKIIFEGTDEINLETLTTSLFSTLETLELISKNVLNEEDYSKFIVKSVDRGSFIVDIHTIVEIANSLLPFTGMIGTHFSVILKLRKFLKGKEPKKVINNKDNESCTIVNADNIEMNFPIETINIYIKEDNIEKTLAKAARSLSKDETRSGLQVITSDDEVDSVQYTRDDLQLTSTSIDVDSFNNEIEVYKQVETLTVESVNFKGTKMWQFNRPGAGVISAQILDDKFIERVNEEHISFANSTKMTVLLEIRHNKNKGETKRATKYSVLEVVKIHNDEQVTLQFPNEEGQSE